MVAVEQKPSIVILGGSQWLKAFAPRLSEIFNLILVDRNIHCPCRKYADVFLNLSTFDYLQIHQALKQMAVVPAWIIPAGTGACVYSAAWLASKFKLPHTPLTLAERFSSKLRLCELLSTINTEVAETSPAKQVKDIASFPQYLKHIAKSGGSGIRLVSDESELQHELAACEDLESWYLETAVAGDEYAALIFSTPANSACLGLLKRLAGNETGKPLFAYIPTPQHSQLSQRAIRAALDLVHREQALSWNFLEFIQTDKGHYFFEWENNLPGSGVIDQCLEPACGREIIPAVYLDPQALISWVQSVNGRDYVK